MAFPSLPRARSRSIPDTLGDQLDQTCRQRTVVGEKVGHRCPGTLPCSALRMCPAERRPRMRPQPTVASSLPSLPLLTAAVFIHGSALRMCSAERRPRMRPQPTAPSSLPSLPLLAAAVFIHERLHLPPRCVRQPPALPAGSEYCVMHNDDIMMTVAIIFVYVGWRMEGTYV